MTENFWGFRYSVRGSHAQKSKFSQSDASRRRVNIRQMLFYFSDIHVCVLCVKVCAEFVCESEEI